MTEEKAYMSNERVVSDGPVQSVQSGIVGRKLDADEALKAFSDSAESVILDEATERRLLRRIDMMLMPILFLVYGLNFLDKTTLSYASVMGIQKDIRLEGSNYQWLGSMFYFGYLGWEYPAARLLQRLPLAKYSAVCIILWGLAVSCFATVENFSGAVALRFFLGLLEASVSPGWVLSPLSANGIAQILGGLVAYGIVEGSELHGFTIKPWKIMFLFTGLLTVVAGLVFLAIVPDNQLNAWWLSKGDRVLAIERVRSNQQGIGNKHFKAYQLREALLDPITWAFVFFSLVSDIPNGGLTNFFSSLIESFGFSAKQSLLHGVPAGAVWFVGLVAWGYITQRFGNRLLWSVVGMTIATLGSILNVALPLSNRSGRLVGYYLTSTNVIGDIAVVSLISSNVAGYTKKTTIAALFFIAYCVGNIISPQTFRPKDALHYTPAEITLVVCYGLGILDILFIFWYYRKQNSKKIDARARPGYRKLENQEWLDLTDRENPEFMYEL